MCILGHLPARWRWSHVHRGHLFSRGAKKGPGEILDLVNAVTPIT